MIVAFMDVGESVADVAAELAFKSNPNSPSPGMPFKPSAPKISLYGVPTNKKVPAPLFWWITKRSTDSISDKRVELKDDEPIDFSWKYTEYEPNQF